MLNFVNYFVLDAAQIETELDLAFKLNANNKCLYIGESETTLKYVAPYLFTHEIDSDFSKWLLLKKQQEGVGIFIQSKASFDQLYKHLRTLLFVTTEDGEELYFRFYDPFVADIYLHTYDVNQLRDFFGPINFIILETETPNMFKQIWHENGMLKVNEFEFVVEQDEKLDERIAQLKQKIDEDKEREDMEEVERINKKYNGDNPAVVNNVVKGKAIVSNDVETKPSSTSPDKINLNTNSNPSYPTQTETKKEEVKTLPNKGWRMFD